MRAATTKAERLPSSVMPDTWLTPLSCRPGFRVYRESRSAVLSGSRSSSTENCCGKHEEMLACPESGRPVRLISITTISRLERETRPGCYLGTCNKITIALGLSPREIIVCGSQLAR